MCMLDDKSQTPDRNNLKLGIIVVLDTISKPIDFKLKKVKDHGHKVP